MKNTFFTKFGLSVVLMIFAFGISCSAEESRAFPTVVGEVVDNSAESLTSVEEEATNSGNGDGTVDNEADSVQTSGDGVEENATKMWESGSSVEEEGSNGEKSDSAKHENGDGGLVGGADETKNLFEELYSTAVDNSDKIFSILAFIGTLVVGVGYKSGFLPLLRDALSKLKSSIDSANEESSKNNMSTKEELGLIEESLDRLEEMMEDDRETLTELAKRTRLYEELAEQRESVNLIMRAQVDMLYSIFMSSSLPQYQKDEIGEKIREMKKELQGYETE